MAHASSSLLTFGEEDEGPTIVMAGLDNAGKSTILQYTRKGIHVSTAATLGFEVDTLDIEALRFKIFDLGGQKRFRDIWEGFLRRADVFIYVVDAADEERFGESKEEFDRALQYIQTRTFIAFFINKIDIAPVENSEKISSIFELDKVDQEKEVFKTSGLTSEGLRQAFYWIYEKITGKMVTFPEYRAPMACIEAGNFVCCWRNENRCGLPISECISCDIAFCQNCVNFTPDCKNLFQGEEIE